MIYGVGATRAATQAASHIPKALLHATRAGLAAIATPAKIKRLNKINWITVKRIRIKPPVAPKTAPAAEKQATTSAAQPLKKSD